MHLGELNRFGSNALGFWICATACACIEIHVQFPYWQYSNRHAHYKNFDCPVRAVGAVFDWELGADVGRMGQIYLDIWALMLAPLGCSWHGADAINCAIQPNTG